MSNYNDNQNQGQDNNQDRGLFSGIYNAVHGVNTESTQFTGNYQNPNQQNQNYNQNQGNNQNHNQGYNQNQNQGYNPSTGANPSAGQYQQQPQVCPPAPGGNGISYGSHIALKHNNTGRYLSSSNISYQGGSQQQQITCNQWNVSENDKWELLAGFNQGGNGVIQYNQIVRIRHIATGRHLHSHSNINSPVSQYQEVSGYGNQNLSDDNDNWIVEKFDYNGQKPQGNWQPNDPVCFKHEKTGLYLFSHDRAINVNGATHSEVAAFGNGRDENNKWYAQLF